MIFLLLVWLFVSVRFRSRFFRTLSLSIFHTQNCCSFGMKCKKDEVGGGEEALPVLAQTQRCLNVMVLLILALLLQVFDVK